MMNDKRIIRPEWVPSAYQKAVEKHNDNKADSSLALPIVKVIYPKKSNTGKQRARHLR